MIRSCKVQFIFFTLVMHFGFIVFPFLFLKVYQSILFPIFRIVYDYTFGLSPIPVIYLAAIGIFVYIFIKGKDLFKYRHAFLYAFYYKEALKKIILFFLMVASIFYWVWGFQYYQKSLFTTGDQTDVVVDDVYLRNEIQSVTLVLNQLRGKIQHDDIQRISASEFVHVENILREDQKNIFSQLGVNVVGKVRVRVIAPEGVLLRWSTAGIYIPFVFEAHIDAGLHPLQYVFTAAHEMAHGFGITNEGDCNVLGLLTCLQADRTEIRYAGLLTYFRYLWYDPRLKDTDKNILVEKLSPLVKNDLSEIREQSKKFPDIFPAIRDYIYDFYLRWMGEEDGISSYNSMVDKVAVIKRQKPEMMISK